MPSLPVSTPNPPVTEINEDEDPTPGSGDSEVEIDPKEVAATLEELKPGKTADPAQKPKAEPEIKAAPKQPYLGEVTVDEQLLAEYNKVKITLKSFDFDSNDGLRLKMLIENDSDASIKVSAFYESVNGVMMSSTFYTSVEPGKKENKDMFFFPSYFQYAGIDIITEVDFYLQMSFPGSPDISNFFEPISIKTSAFGNYSQVYDDSGTKVYDENGIKFVVQGINNYMDNRIWGPGISIYVENTGDMGFEVYMIDVSINGQMLYPCYTLETASGKRVYASINLRLDEIDKYKIESIEKLEFSLQIPDPSTDWYEFIETERFVVNFNN